MLMGILSRNDAVGPIPLTQNGDSYRQIKFCENIPRCRPTRKWQPYFRWTHGPTEFSNRQRNTDEKMIASEMLTMDVYV